MWIRKVALMLAFICPLAYAKDHVYQPGKLLAVNTEERLSEGTTYSHALFTVQADGLRAVMAYEASFEPQFAS